MYKYSNYLKKYIPEFILFHLTFTCIILGVLITLNSGFSILVKFLFMIFCCILTIIHILNVRRTILSIVMDYLYENDKRWIGLMDDIKRMPESEEV